MIKSPPVTNDKRNLTDRKVILGLSGGVDSAVAAILLQERGADVQALHMTNWEDDDGYCTAAADLQDARIICEQLKIPLHHVNFSSQYRDHVFSNFLAEYKAGRTPNPDVLCNREIKFGVFREHAKRLGGDLIATGHYAQCRTNDSQVCLYKAQDRSKDQSYFLHAVSGQALAETVFPLGDVEKSTVRAIARDHGLAVHNKKDSTGICFIGERPFREFLASFLPASPGPIETPDGKVVGDHQGLMYYTLGQRQGLGIGGLKDASDEPWYVAAKDLARNALIVVQGNHPLLYSDSLEATDVHWIGPMPDAIGKGLELDCAVKIRYRQDDQSCSVATIDENRLSVTFATPQMAVTPGQFAVFYAADRCLGGAVIDSASIADSAKDALRKTG
jgi:tRNA-specific 2-thiouridylase